MLPCMSGGRGLLSVEDGALPSGRAVAEVVVSCFSAPGYIGTPGEAAAVLVPVLSADLPPDVHPAINARPMTTRTAETTAMLLFFISSGLLRHRGISVKRPSLM
jgi:hypothetical protein